MRAARQGDSPDPAGDHRRAELTPADRRACEMYLATQRFKGFEKIHADFSPDAAADDRGERARAGCARAGPGGRRRGEIGRVR
jgi:hypothetical protein